VKTANHTMACSKVRRHGSVSGVKYTERYIKYIERYTSPETLSCIFTRAGEMRAPKIFGFQ